jgi:3D-(3,5/4)-trihydroxycyclohexane-1,2-dione acylhydrolase (decyclizing)
MARALVSFLDNQYVCFDGETVKFVDGIYGIFGHGIAVGLGEALAAKGCRLRFYQAKNEQGAGHAATAYAKQNNRLRMMAACSSIGPGALNMVTAAGTATANHIPALFLPGDVYACRRPNPGLQQIEALYDHTGTASDALRPVSRYWDRVNRPEQLMAALINAFHVLTDPADTGAVTISLPQDVQGEAYDYPEEFLAKRIHYIERRPPTPGQIERASGLIWASKKPLAICGGGVRYSDAGAELEAFCESGRIPFGETQGGKGTILWDNPYNLSGIGAAGSLAANKLAKEADLIIAVGTRLDDFTACSKWLFQNPDAQILGINIAPFDAYKMKSAPIVADAKLTLQELNKAMQGYSSEWGGKIQAAKDEWNREVDRLYSRDHPLGLTQTRVLGELNERLLLPETIVVSNSDSASGDMQKVWRTRVIGTYHMEYAFSCMGYEVAAALGVKTACPDREVVAIMGGGAYTMLHTELLTAVQERKKIIVVVLDTSGFRYTENLQCSHDIIRFDNESKKQGEKTGLREGSPMQVDYAKNAESWGALGLRARTVDDLRGAVQKALDAKGPVLIDVKVTPNSMTYAYEVQRCIDIAQASLNRNIMATEEKMGEAVFM